MKKKLSPAKQALLDNWLKGKASTNQVTGISKRPQNSSLSLSFPQQRQLFLELLDRDTAVNNLSVFLQLKGKLDIDALTKSANQIFERHEVLSTKFSFNLGIPALDFLIDFKITIPIVSLQESAEKDLRKEARLLAEKEILQPFDLTQGPLIRLKLYQLDKEESLLLFTAHHTIADGWSLGVFLQELMIFYQANKTGTSAQIPELEIQYSDYAHWQNDETQKGTLESSMSYWKNQLSGELSILELPTDYSRGAKQTFTGGTHRFVISKDLTKSLEELSRQEDVTLFMTLLTAFNILLHRYSGQEEILVGTPTANRNRPELEQLIGVFINTLVLRTNLSDEQSFRELLKEVRKITTEAYAHQDLPFEKLVEELKPKRDLSRTPLFQVVFNLQSSPMPKLEIGGLETTFMEIDRGVSQFDLTLMISKIEGACFATVEYNSDLFKPATIKRIFDSFHLILKDALAQPDRSISKLQLISQEERNHIVNQLNQTQLDFPREKCMHQLFESQVEENPDAVAIIYDQTQLTYVELNQHANVLARHLQKIGVDPNVRVGILMEKSLELIPALLGVHKAGGAYVPIHISSPTDRIEFILKDAAVKVLLTNMNFDPLDGFEGTVIQMDSENLSLKSDNSNLPTLVNSDHLAYTIYTSGSTGKPKGVMVNHYSLTNFLCSMRNQPGINKGDVLMAVTSISFDIAALELFLPLIAGATVVMASEEMTKNPMLIGEAINKHQVNMLQATPATWQILIEIGWQGKPELKALCGGDVLTRKLANLLLDRVNVLWNMYGPTETTIWSSISKIEKDDAPITIGQPIGNTQLYILDTHLQPVPHGVVGELHIGGEGLAKGYLNQPDLTQEKFIPDLISAQSGSLLYKTGDYARYLSDDSIEVLGRMDDQLKINGHRLELGEITTVLMQHPLVTDGIVITRTEASGEKKLVAYFIKNDDQPLTPNELREFIGKQLPTYMIPAYFVSMESFPLTPNGKIDRKSLAIPEDIRPPSGYVAPRNEEEEILTKIWLNVLDIEQVGIHDNFFDLGGASIQSIQVMAKANMYGYGITVENIFEYQTIAELAELIKNNLQ